MKNDLIYDVGMNDGSDTAFYLHKGYRVVAIEANPELCDKVGRKFSNHIQADQLKILNVAVAEKAEELDFYVNLDVSEWSSLDRAWGTRDGTRFKVIKVSALPFSQILKEHGVPYYLKIDVEGADHIVLRQLQAMEEKPQFISCEEHDLEYFPLLWGLGYRGFKIVNQQSMDGLVYDGWKFKGGSSGPFGDETQGEWMSFSEAFLDYMLNIRDCRGRELFVEGWFDIHATLDVPGVATNLPYPKRRKASLKSRVRSLKRKVRSSLSRLK